MTKNGPFYPTHAYITHHLAKRLSVLTLMRSSANSCHTVSCGSQFFQITRDLLTELIENTNRPVDLFYDNLDRRSSAAKYCSWLLSPGQKSVDLRKFLMIRYSVTRGSAQIGSDHYHQSKESPIRCGFISLPPCQADRAPMYWVSWNRRSSRCGDNSSLYGVNLFVSRTEDAAQRRIMPATKMPAGNSQQPSRRMPRGDRTNPENLNKKRAKSAPCGSNGGLNSLARNQSWESGMGLRPTPRPLKMRPLFANAV